jgi:hypothetical protein
VTFDIAWRLDQAIGYVLEGKAVDWRDTVEEAVAYDADAADVHLRRAVLRRLRAINGFDPANLSGLVRLSRSVAQSFDADFAVPAFLIEFVIRRALDETGCCDFLDLREVAFASTQLCAALDAQSRLFPPGWNSGVYVRI